MFTNCAIALGGGGTWLGGGKYWHSGRASWGTSPNLSGGMGTLFS